MIHIFFKRRHIFVSLENFIVLLICLETTFRFDFRYKNIFRLFEKQGNLS